WFVRLRLRKPEQSRRSLPSLSQASSQDRVMDFSTLSSRSPKKPMRPAASSTEPENPAQFYPSQALLSACRAPPVRPTRGKANSENTESVIHRMSFRFQGIFWLTHWSGMVNKLFMPSRPAIRHRFEPPNGGVAARRLPISTWQIQSWKKDIIKLQLQM